MSVSITTAALLIAATGFGGSGATQEPPAKIQLPPRAQRPGNIKLPPGTVLRLPLSGWADLHAHPASHLAFGAPNSGGTTLIAGLPGLRREDNTIATDLKPCSANHFWDDADIVRSSLRTAVRNAMDGGLPHGRAGFPEFFNWPHARSVLHQQMHVTWVHRAYLGGQRLMVASVTDNQTLAMVWNRHNFATRPQFDPNSDFESAKRQIAFIERWAGANSSWMQIVTTPAEARTAITNNKLALILGLEMDKLTTAQTLTLIRDHKVRQVIPIHLADNHFGGTAAYSDMFNTNSHFQNGHFIKVVGDSALRFRFNRPQFIRYIDHTEVNDALSGLFAMLTLGTIGVGAVKPTGISDAEYNALGYKSVSGGHRNNRPTNINALKTIFQTGVLMDVSHMSEVAQRDALQIATTADYPVMNSHSGLRDSFAESERSMRTSDAQTMSRLGGILGIGTVGENDIAVVANENSPDGQNHFLRLTNNEREWTRAPRIPHIRSRTAPYRHLRVSVTTGNDDKRNNEGAWAILLLKDGKRLEFPLDPKVTGLGGGSMLTLSFDMGRDVSFDQISRVGVRHHTGSYFKDGLWRDPDNWDLASFKMELLPDPVTTWTRDAAECMDTMAGKIALGTDFNGLEKLLPGQSTIQMGYPVDIVQRFAPNMRIAGGAAPPTLNPQQFGARVMFFSKDGLAEYGMLPDFLQAVSRAPRGEEVVRALFRGAENVVTMWEKSVEARVRVR